MLPGVAVILEGEQKSYHHLNLLNTTALENIVSAPNCRIIEFIEPEKLLRHVLQRYSYFATFICFVCISPGTQSAEWR